MKNIKRKKIKALLYLLEAEQVSIFYLMYGAVDAVPDKQLAWAIKQCERTIKDNNVSKLKDLLHIKK